MILVPEPGRVQRGESDWIQTFSSKRFFPLDPQPEEVSILDIAHALSNLCRFTGHVTEFYSVAEHSVRVSREIEKRVQPDRRRTLALWGLLHDASEAYLCDLPRPLKRAPGFGQLYKAYEMTLSETIMQRFGLDTAEPPLVKEVDNALLETERRDLMNRPPQPWRDKAEPLAEAITKPWPPAVARYVFLNRFVALAPSDPEVTDRSLEAYL